MNETHWNVAAYEAFHDLRLRPALDLLARVPSLTAGDIVDLGCGAGPVAPALRSRFPGETLIGVDHSDDMLAKAGERALYDALVQSDITQWRPASPPSLIFSNAALHWVDGHDVLFPALYSALRPGGALAIQVPSQIDMPAQCLMRNAAADVRPDLFTGWRPFPGHRPTTEYVQMLSGAATDLWFTEYLQRLTADGSIHPVRAFTASAAARPIYAKLEGDDVEAFDRIWEAGLAEAYPISAEGEVWYPFRRFFLIARKPEA
ncbi:MAG: methyltransferase domain-containing protein [Pseudomonadota bacterium]